INEVFDKETKDYYHYYRTVNDKNSKDVIKGMEYVLIELPKFQPSTTSEKKAAVLWLRFLREIKEGVYLDPAPELFENEYIAQAINMCKEGAFTPAELAAYDHYWDVIRRERSIIKDGLKMGEAKGEAKGLAEGLAEGLAKGRVEGRAEGRVEGRVEGLAEGEVKAKENIVVKSFKNGFSIEIISSITDLSKDEIIPILEKHGLKS
ncbi:MAG: PD-(D/E)XK nuclease family transposase, partial [Prevotellaceae bacterium]|nr:PD-(D/E)XK nuclease family transposase [Prevotellaceae bacterium]